MGNPESSKLTILYDNTVIANIGDEILDYVDPRNFRFKIVENENFEINRIRITDPELKGQEILTDNFETAGTYKQVMYVFINGIKELLPNQIMINDRLALPEEVITMGEDIIVLQREINISEEEAKDLKEAEENFDVTPEELAEKTNSVWKNEAVKPTKMYVRLDQVAHIYDAFGDEDQENDFEPGIEFTARIRRINVLEELEYFKVFDNTYILTYDAIDENTYNYQKAAKKAREEGLEAPEPYSPVEEDEGPQRIQTEEDITEEEVEPFKVIINPDIIPMFLDRQGIGIMDKKPDPASIWEVSAVLHNDFTGADYYKVDDDEYILKTDTIKYSEDNLEKAKADAKNNNFNFFLTHGLTGEEDTEAGNIPTPVESEPIINETAQVDAHAARKEFEDETAPKEINGIVQVRGDKDETHALYNSFRDDRQELDSTVKGQTFWYTTTVGEDNSGKKFYEIAVNEWVDANDVNYFENN